MFGSRRLKLRWILFDVVVVLLAALCNEVLENFIKRRALLSGVEWPHLSLWLVFALIASLSCRWWDSLDAPKHERALTEEEEEEWQEPTTFSPPRHIRI
jgi:hypothetical protein